MNDARLEDAVELQARAGSEFDIRDQAFAFGRIDAEPFFIARKCR